MLNKKMALSVLMLAGVAAVSGCASNSSMESRLEALETKVAALEGKTNEALRKSSAAKVDAATALHIANK
jgi:outer membrane murein-binding lipoprotein Lpp